jgi:aquaporin TIP
VEGDYFRRAAGEFVGTFALVFIGVGSLIYGNIVGVAFAHGLVIAVMASAVGHITGGHFNPAVTLGFLVTRRMAASLAALYMIVQVGAATLAALVLKWVLPNAAYDGVNGGAPSLQNGLNGGQGVVVEAILTFFLLWVIFATAADPRGTFKQIAGLAIGFTIVLDILMGGGLTGAAMNPARSLGPEIVSGNWDDWWVYIIGPFCGGVIAAVIYEVLYLRPARPVPVGPPETGLEEPRPGDAALE